MSINDILNELGIKGADIISGIMGGIISLTYEKATFMKALIMIFAGGVTAAYCVPFLTYRMNLGDGSAGFLGFIIGLTSMRFIGFLITMAQKKFNKINEDDSSDKIPN